jgi:hypothetical protein
MGNKSSTLFLLGLSPVPTFLALAEGVVLFSSEGLVLREENATTAVPLLLWYLYGPRERSLLLKLGSTGIDFIYGNFFGSAFPLTRQWGVHFASCLLNGECSVTNCNAPPSPACHSAFHHGGGYNNAHLAVSSSLPSPSSSSLSCPSKAKHPRNKP